MAMGRGDIWFRPSVEESSLFWGLLSKCWLLVAISLGKLWLGLMGDTAIEGVDTLHETLSGRRPGQPLITICNHHSFVDWFITSKSVRWRYVFDVDRYMPWQPAAQEFTYRYFVTSFIFSCWRAVPLVRGQGVYQWGMDFMVKALNKGHWVNVYPEGRINKNKEATKFKTGIGRLIDECENLPLILPYYHLGMDSVMPNRKPYYPRRGQTVTVLYGQPLDLTGIVQDIKGRTSCKETVHRLIAEELESHMESLAARTHEMHNRRLSVSKATCQ